MSPNVGNVTLQTEADEIAEREIMEAWMLGNPYVADRLPKFARADFFVVSAHGRDLLECKDRQRYSSAFMAREGFIIGVNKVKGVIEMAGERDAYPWVLFRTTTDIILLDAAYVVDRAGVRKDFVRERGPGRHDTPEDVYVVPGNLWAARRSRVNMWAARRSR